MKNLIFVFFFLVSIPLIAVPAEEKIQFFYNIPPQDHPDERGVRVRLIQEIDSAKESLEGAFYQVNDPQVIDALLRAVERGVRVELVTDTDWVLHKDYREGYERLKKGGVTVVEDQRFGLSHNKYCIIDRESSRARVWMGSTNVTTQCNLRNGNASFLLIGNEAAQIFYLDFKQMIEGKFQNNKGGIFQAGDQWVVVQDKLKTPAGLDVKDFSGIEGQISYPTLSLDGTSIEIFFSPRHNIERKVIEALYSAKESIHFATYTLDNPMIYQTMMNKAKIPNDPIDRESPYNLYPVMYRQDPWEESHQFFHLPGKEGGVVKKVTVYGIINRLGSSDGPYRAFLEYGIPVRMSAFPGALHHKFIIIDKEILILGSYNFSASAESENDESAIIIRDKKIAGQFYEKVFVPTYQHSYPEYLPSQEELKEFAPLRKEIAISEIHFLPKKGALEAKYVELHNYATCSSESECEERSIDLRGWKLWNGLIPWHDNPRIRGTTDDLVSYYYDPYKNRHGMNHERG
ncbi:MAG: phospholipase D-like domain-containing protein, partial [Deltaproteobacteria bacterium]